MLIIGAGPAGASAAVVARGLGLSVALVDQARFPRDKLCGGGLTGRCWGHLGDVFGPLPPQLYHEMRALRLVAEGRLLADLPDAPPLRMTMRRDLDHWMVTRARNAGAEDFTGCRLGGINVQEASVQLSEGRVLRGKVLIGADGVKSAVGRALFGRSFDPAGIGFGLEVELPGPPLAATELDLTAAGWGYGWAFPKREGTTLGVGGILGRNPDMKAHLAAYAARHGTDLAGPKVKGHHLPFGERRPAPGRGQVLLAGDAAGFVDPLTGEGIGWAIRSGQLAAEVAAAALAAGRPDTVFARYDRATRHLRGELRRARQLRALVYHPRLQPRFLRLMQRDPRLQRRYLALLAGQMDYADISLAAWPRLIWRLLAGRRP